MERDASGVWNIVQGVAVALVLAAFLWALGGLLTPLVLFFVLWAVMLPFRGAPGHGVLLAVAALLTLVWTLATTGSLLAPFVLASVLAYILDPLVDVVERRRVPRGVAIVSLTLPAVGALAAFVFLVLPGAVAEVGDVLEQAPVFFERIATWVEGARDFLLGIDLPLVKEEAIVDRLRAVDSEAVVAFLQERQDALIEWLWKAVLGVGRGLGSMVGIVGYVVLTPVLTFYLLRDWDRITASMKDLIPLDRRGDVVSFTADFDALLSRYLRGQFTVAVVIGVITGVGLAVVRFPHAATLGLIVAVFSVVPYLGLLLSLLPAVFIALVSGSVGVSLLKVAVVYGVAQGLEGAVVSPRIVGESVGLHPVWLLLALAMGGFFFGFVGLLIAVPVAVGFKLVIVRGMTRYRTSEFYLGSRA